MTTNPPGNDSGTPIHDRTAASDGHEIHPGVTVPSFASGTPAPRSTDPDAPLTYDAYGDDAAEVPFDAPLDAIPADEQLPPATTGISGAPTTGPGGSGSTTGTAGPTGSTGSTGAGTGSGSTGVGTGSGTTGGGTADQAKSAAQDVAGDAKAKAADVAGTAKEQASNVASEATDHAK
ncbi:MAG: hypothetical protein ACTHMH_09220 [Curtobacterium sp.]